MLYNSFKLFLENELNKDFFLNKFVEKLNQYNLLDNIEKIINYLISRNYVDYILRYYYNNKNLLMQDIKTDYESIYDLKDTIKRYFDKIKYEINAKDLKIFKTSFNIFNFISLIYSGVIQNSYILDSFSTILSSVESFDKNYNTDFSSLIKEEILTDDNCECLVKNIYNLIYTQTENNLEKFKDFLSNTRKIWIKNNSTIDDIAQQIFSIYMYQVSYMLSQKNSKKYFKHKAYSILNTTVVYDLLKDLNINIKDVVKMCLYPDNYEVDWRPNETTPEDYYAL